MTVTSTHQLLQMEGTLCVKEEEAVFSPALPLLGVCLWVPTHTARTFQVEMVIET